MNTTDKERLDALLSPLKERLEAFNQTVTNNSKENTANKTEIKTTFEEAMKRLHAEQELTIKAMREDQERAVRNCVNRRNVLVMMLLRLHKPLRRL